MYLDFTQRFCGNIQARIDVFMPFYRAETPGEIHAFVNDNLVRNVDARLELIRANQKYTELDGIELFERPIDQGVDEFLEAGLPLADRGKLFIEERLVNTFVRDLLVKLRQQLGYGMPGNLLLVKRLQ